MNKVLQLIIDICPTSGKSSSCYNCYDIEYTIGKTFHELKAEYPESAYIDDLLTTAYQAYFSLVMREEKWQNIRAVLINIMNYFN